jgi:hypothetical protein
LVCGDVLFFPTYVILFLEEKPNEKN